MSEADRIFSQAQAYELFMGRWSRRIAPLLVRFARIRDGDRVLDVGSGTGALASTVATIAPSSRVVGIDPSARYVALAHLQHGRPNLGFAVGDAQQLPFGAATFDRSLSLLVFTFIPNPRQALAEMARVTRPDGTLAAAVWDYGEGMEMLRAFWDEATVLAPASGAKDERNLPLCRRGDLAALWREYLDGVVEDALTIEMHFASFDDFWMPFLEKQGPAGAYTASLAAADRETLRSRLRQRLVGTGSDKPIVMHARAWAVRGTPRRSSSTRSR
jgi:SAM-dependent methyltransferase